MTYQPGALLREVRAKISTLGAGDPLDELGSFKALFDQLQELKDEMNQAKKEAAAKAAEPYLETMQQIESKYALLLKLKT